MAKQLKLSVTPRVESGRSAVKKIRARGAIPAVIYGGEGPPSNLEVNAREIGKILAHAAGENILVELQIAGEGGKILSRLSLIQEIQHHPVRGEILHLDFRAVSATDLIQVEIPIEAEGEPEGVKTGNGLLEQSLRVLQVECLPQNLPDVIRVDVTALEMGSSCHVQDIILPEGVKAITDPELTVFRVSEPTIAPEPSTIPQELTAPEVIKEKKPVEASVTQQETPKK